MLRKKIRKSQGGFTLIEIIAVLVIIGILAAVAIPRFITIQDESRARVADGAIAAAMSNLSLGYAKSLINSNYTDAPKTVCENVTVSGAESFVITCTPTGTAWANIGNVTVAATYGGQGGAERTWVQP